MESDLSALQTLGKRFYDVHNDAASTLLCLDHAFSRPFKILVAPCAEVASVLEIFLIYARELQKVMSEHNPFHKEFIQQLFYLQVSEDDMVVVKEKTFLYQATCQFPGLKVEGQTVTRHIQDLLTPFQQALKFHLLGRVTTENSACMFARAFWPCTAFAALGKCNRAANCQRGHIDSSKLDNEWYHSWLRIHFQQILIYQTIAPFETPSIVEKNQM